MARAGQAHVPLLVALVLGLSGCRTAGYIPLIQTIDRGDAEARYHAALALAGHDRPVVRNRLRRLLESDEPMTRNAAAAALASLGEEEAAAALIGNLHRDRRTYVTTGAIHHLREIFGIDLGYDPNLGYRHQTERQAAWWAWWEERGHARPPEEDGLDAEKYDAARRDLAPRIGAYSETERPTGRRPPGSGATSRRSRCPVVPTTWPSWRTRSARWPCAGRGSWVCGATTVWRH